MAGKGLQEALALLPQGMTRSAFAELAGFAQGLEASSAAAVEASADVIANLKNAGVSAEAISAWQSFYEAVAAGNPGNLSAIQRAALLRSILGGY